MSVDRVPPEIVISEFMDEALVAQLLRGREYLFDAALVDRPQDLLAALADARALIVRNRTQVHGPLLDAAPRLEVVGRLGVGLDNIDARACAVRGITVYPATGANDIAVAEYALTTALVLLRGAYFASHRVAGGEWPRMQLIGREACGKTFGLVGFGAIARETARRARAFDMHVAAYDPLLDASHPAWSGVTRRHSLEELLVTSDVLSVHVPLTPATRQMIDARALALMKPDAVLVNAARGGIVDEEATVAALRAGRLAGAALDVFEVEPLSSEAGAHMRDVPNLILTPHIAGVTREANVRVSRVTLEAVLAHLDRGSQQQ